MNFFSVALRIIFPMCVKNYFLIGPWIIFRGIANLFFGLQCIAGLAFEVDWFESLTSLGDHFENFASGGVLSKRMSRRNVVRERNGRGFHLSYKICQELVVCRWWWGFLDRRFNRGDYEGTSRLVHNSNPYSTWHVCPIELCSTQSCTSSLRLVLHMLAFGTKTQRMRVSPTLNFRRKLPILIQTGEH